MKKERLVSEILRISERKERAIPIYEKHLETALEFSGLKKGERARAKEILSAVKSGAEGRIARLRRLADEIRRRSGPDDF